MSKIWQPHKLNALHNYIAELFAVSANSRDLISDYDSKTIATHKIFINGVIVTGSYSYDGIIVLVGFSERPYSETELEALISLWLYDNDPYYDKRVNRNGSFPTGITIEREQLDQGRVALTITVQFHGITALIQDNAGVITVDDKKYRVADPTKTAENFEKEFINISI